MNDRLSIGALIFVNLLPLLGIYLLGWDAGMIVLLYWAENLVIGFYNLLMMVTVANESPFSILQKLFMAAFFIVHFGGFCAGHGFFIMAFFGYGSPDDSLFPSNPSPGPLIFVDLLISVIASAWAHRPLGMDWAVFGLFASHGISFIQNYWLAGEYRRTSLNSLMTRPYKRIVILHIAVIAGGVPIMALGSPVPLLIVLIGLKTALDVWLHAKAHKGKRPDAWLSASRPAGRI